MNASTVADVLLIVAAVVWVLAPLVLAFFGIRSLPA